MRYTALGKSTAHFTGKPLDSDSASFLYRFRRYDPELSRWTLSDPSGFPDGANNHLYVKTPTSDIDPDGRLTVTGVTTPNLPTVTVNENSKIYTISANSITSLGGPTLTGVLSVDTYTAASWGSQDKRGGAMLSISVSGVAPIQDTVFRWIQYVTTNNSATDGPGPFTTFTDNREALLPFYDGADAGGGTASSSYFYTPRHQVFGKHWDNDKES